MCQEKDSFSIEEFQVYRTSELWPVDLQFYTISLKKGCNLQGIGIEFSCINDDLNEIGEPSVTCV